MPRVVVLVALTALAAGMVGCGGGRSDTPAADGRAVTTTTEWDGYEPTTEPGAPECPPPEDLDPRITEGLVECEIPDAYYARDATPAERVAALAEAARLQGQPEAAAALADGDLTTAERRQGYQDALDCMTSQGMTVAQFAEYEGLYGTDFTFIVGFGSLSADEAGVVSTNCEGRYTITYKLAIEILRGGRFTERAKQVLQDCMAEYGVTDDVGDTLDELREVSPSQEATLDCTTRAENKPPPPADLPRPPDG